MSGAEVFASRFSPEWCAFGVSLLLSVIAILGAVTPNNDGMLYVETARLFQQGGLELAGTVFDWLTLPVLMALLSSATGMGLESAGYVLCALLLAGTCALAVACVREQFPELGWYAFAAIIAMPAANNYRDYIIREFGAWFFIFLALWLALRWARQPTWRMAIGVQLSILVAALFRLESLVFLLAPVVWQLVLIRREGAPRRLMMMAAPLAGGALVALAVALAGGLEVGTRVVFQLSAADPVSKLERFGEAVNRFSVEILNEFSSDEAWSILFFGILSIIPVKFVSNLGVLVVPAAYGALKCRARFAQGYSPLMIWAVLIYLVVLVAFVLDQLFLTARYVALLNLLTLPLAALGLHAMLDRHPRWRWPVVIVIALAAIANVVSSSPSKTRFIDAAEWLGGQGLVQQEVYIETPEVAHLLEWRFTQAGLGLRGREDVLRAMTDGSVQLALMTGSKKDKDLEEWAVANGLRVVARFEDGTRRTLLAVQRMPEAP